MIFRIMWIFFFDLKILFLIMNELVYQMQKNVAKRNETNFKWLWFDVK